jgi:hypothetical protein
MKVMSMLLQGVLLRVIGQASKAVDKYLEECKTLARLL